MTHADLGGPLLASVSRSFYLSIRLLPETLREPIGLAYLLARASDTIADSASESAPIRLRQLAAFASMVRELSEEGLVALQSEIHPSDPAEEELIAQLGPALAWLRAVEPDARREIQAVLALIIRGQTLDVERFPDTADAGQVRALQSA